MYIRSVLITVLKIKNRIFLFLSLFFIFTAISDIASLISYYWDDWDTIVNAVSFPQSVTAFIVGWVMLIISRFSKKQIDRAVFYSSYFECDLYGVVQIKDLADVVGCSPAAVRRSLKFLRLFYMKGFVIGQKDGQDYAEMYSKKVSCRCRNCGAVIDKKVYFSGLCPYCGTSDIFATVLTDNKVYNITSDFSRESERPEKYLCKASLGRVILLAIAFAISLVVAMVAIVVMTDTIGAYNDYDKILEMIFSGKMHGSPEIVRKQLLSNIIYDIGLLMIAIPLIKLSLRKIILLSCSMRNARKFASSEKPFIRLENSKEAKKLCSQIQSRYLRNCTLGKYDGKLLVSLSKRIVKDKCPTCGAPITGAVSDKYVCNFCGKNIMGVISKA